MKRLVLLGIILLAIGAFFLFDLNQYLTLEQLKARQEDLGVYRDSHPVLASVIYMLIYIGIAALSLPGATLMTLTGGAIFGLVWGTAVADISATLGASIAFLNSRFLFGKWVQNKFGQQIETINQGIDKDGAFYLLSLRLVPAVPFFVINVVMGLTRLRLWTFTWVSAIGMIGGAAVYANAGTQLAQINTISDIASVQLFISFALLGLFPISVRKLLEWVKNRRAKNILEPDA
ncbi:MAG: TVP38/TMEM64 family protein [Reinekea sp.]|jgi:uncharacterized membrane protein YdjX (TVP38/TMEM64 family)